MKTVILEAFVDESTGLLGLGVVGMPRTETTNAAADGVIIAHDLLEHVNGIERIGSIDDELEALGAVWYVRGQFGELRRDGIGSYYSTHENLAADIVQMFREHVDGGADVDLNVPRTRACEADDDFAEVLACADKTWKSEVCDQDSAASIWPAYRAACLARMRIGYRKARRKYKRAMDANALFWQVAEAVGPYAKHVEYEGQQFALTFGFRNGRATAACFEHFDGDEW